MFPKGVPNFSPMQHMHHSIGFVSTVSPIISGCNCFWHCYLSSCTDLHNHHQIDKRR